MKTAKYFVFVLTVVAMILSACGGAPTAAPQPAATQPSAAQSTGKAQLVFWSMWNETEPQAVVLKKLMDGFTATHPDITFSAVWNGRENQTKLRTALAAGTVVDFMDQDSDQVAGGMMSEGLGYALDEFLTQKALDQDAAISSVFSPGILDQYKASDGKHYLWPIMSSPIMFWYNKDILAKAGVQPPATWDDLLTVCDKVKAATGLPAITTESNEPEYDNYWLNYMVERQKGPDFLAQALVDKTGAMWKDPVFAKSIQMFKDLWAHGCFPQDAKGFIWPAGQQLLATDQAAMELCGSWLPNELRDTTRADFKWGGFPFPAVTGGAGNGGDIHIWTGSMMILKSSAHPKEVFEFFKYVMTNENQATLSKDAIQGVPNKTVAWPEALTDGANAANNAHTVILAIGGGLAFHPEFVKNVLSGNLSKAFYGDMTPDQFSTKMADDAAAYWKTHDK